MKKDVAPKVIDDALFKSQPPEIRELNKQARRELRLKQREHWAKEKGLK